MNTQHGRTNVVETAVTRDLAGILANSYALYLKTQNYHWNVEGPAFHALHALFQEQYEELATAIDDIAERMRALGAYAPGSFAELSTLSTLSDPTRGNAAEMVSDLEQSQAALIDGARAALASSEAADDPVTADLLTQRIAVHEKAAWMLRSTMA